MHQSTTPSLSQTIWPRWASRQFLTVPIVQTLLPVSFGYSLSSDAVIMRQLRRWKRLWRRSLTRSRKKTSIGPSRSCWNGTTRALLRSGLEFNEYTINKSAHTKKVWKLIVCTSYIYIYIYIYIEREREREKLLDLARKLKKSAKHEVGHDIHSLGTVPKVLDWKWNYRKWKNQDRLDLCTVSRVLPNILTDLR